MKVLMIEDNQFKIDNILMFLEASLGLNNIVVRKSYNTALNEILSNNQYDVILLDISIPNFDFNSKESSGEFMPLGGKHLLSQIYLNDIKSKVIVITMFTNFNDGSEMKDLDNLFKSTYSDNYIGFVFYSSDLKWQKELKSLFEKAVIC